MVEKYKIYSPLLGNKRDISIYPSMEKFEEDSYILSPFNAYSSLAYFVMSCYISAFTQSFYFINFLGVFIGHMLSTFSFLWWASQKDTAQRIDIVLYSGLILWPGFHSLVHMNPENEVILSLLLILGIFYCFLHIFQRGVDKTEITIFNIISFIFSFTCLVRCINPTNYLYIIGGLNIIILGFLMKFFDTYKVLSPNIIGSGTGWFHILTALGVMLLWSGF